jgi:hypothetical protein
MAHSILEKEQEQGFWVKTMRCMLPGGNDGINMLRNAVMTTTEQIEPVPWTGGGGKLLRGRQN